MPEECYPGFDVPADKLKKFVVAPSANLFTLMLLDGSIIHYTAADADAFLKWLVQHKIEHIYPEIRGSRSSG